MKRFEHISALGDGELQKSEFDRAMENLSDDEIEKWNEYHLIGDLLRSTDLNRFNNPTLIDSIARKISAEPTVLAPQLHTLSSRHLTRFFKQPLSLARTRSFALSMAAVAFVATGFYQLVPPLDSEIQIVQTRQINGFSESDLDQWQEYLLSHQQNSVRNGLAAVSPIARVDMERPLWSGAHHVLATTSGASDWMNVWEAENSALDQDLDITYVSARH